MVNGAVLFYTCLPLPSHLPVKFGSISRVAPAVGLGIGGLLTSVDWLLGLGLEPVLELGVSDLPPLPASPVPLWRCGYRLPVPRRRVVRPHWLYLLRLACRGCRGQPGGAYGWFKSRAGMNGDHSLSTDVLSFITKPGMEGYLREVMCYGNPSHSMETKRRSYN